MQWVKVNLNNKVRFRITELGRKFITENYSPQLAEAMFPNWQSGETETQIHCLMAEFGPHMKIGFNVPIETVVELETD